MKNIKNIMRGAAVLAIAMVTSVPAMAQGNYVPKNEFSISGFGGLSSLQYKIEEDKWKHNIGFGGGMGFDWTYHFDQHWGIRLGIQGALYQAKAECEYLASENMTLKEKDKALYAQIPLMVQWMTPVGNHNFYAALGGKFGYRIWDNFKINESEGDYNWNTQGYIDLKRINAMGSAELGMRWTLGNGVGLYTGLYFDYGFLKVNDKDVENMSIINLSTYDRTQAKERLVDKVNTMAGGLVLRLSFGKPTIPVVTCPDCPEQQVVIKKVYETVYDTVYVEKEVPQEIKQKMKDLSNALFAFDKFDINPKAASILDDIAAWMKQNPDLKLELAGHTDSKGSDAYNQTLSEKRAKAVRDFLVQRGVSANSLSYKGYGESEPIATNDTAEGRQLNRRVELRIVK